MTESNGNAPAGRNAGGRFTAGNKFSRGRRGNRAKLGEDFLAALAAEFRRTGKSALERAARDEPVQFIKTIANLLPKQLQETLTINQTTTLNVELATWSTAYDNWGKFLGAQPPPKLIESKPNGDDDPAD